MLLKMSISFRTMNYRLDPWFSWKCWMESRGNGRISPEFGSWFATNPPLLPIFKKRPESSWTNSMTEFLFGAATAFWLGILTSISPCPLATNIAAISFIGRKVENPRHVLLSGALYALGRSLTYLSLGILLATALLSAPHLSHWLQKYMNKLLGPVLILVGMFLLDLLRLNLSGPGMSEAMRGRVEKMGVGGAGLLGILLALSFCPVSAALFFGSLIPIAVKSGSGILLPSLYGIGTALPAILFAILIAFGVSSVGRIFNRITRIEPLVRRITGLIFVGIGIYFSLAHIFQVFP